jgi:hypothetical protein
MPFFSNADIPIAFETLAWVQAFLVDPNPNMKRSRDSTGESICPFCQARAGGKRSVHGAAKRLQPRRTQDERGAL